MVFQVINPATDAKPGKRRWFLPTPAWLVFGAAVATGVLFAAERWRWFPDEYQKGWPVVLAVAVVAAVLILMPLWMIAAAMFRRRVQFGLRALLAFVTLSALVCGWLSVRIKEARQQAKVVATLQEKLHGAVYYDWGVNGRDELCFNPEPHVPALLEKLLGIDFFGDVQGYELKGVQVTDEALAGIDGLPRLKVLWLISNQITDAGLSHLEGLSDLRYLDLVHTKTTDEGLEKLKHALPNCRVKFP
jgi:hypothetical protein